SRGLHDSDLFARLGRRGPSPARSGGPHRHRELRARFTGLPERVGEPRARERAPEAQVVRAHVGAATRDGAAWIRDHHAVAPPHEPHEHPLGPHPPTPETRAPRLLGHAGAPVSSPWASASRLRSRRMPVSLAASRAFWPFLPIASESWLSGTMTSADGWPSGSLGAVITTDDTFAGDSARATNVAGSCDHSMMSIFSPRSSRLMTWMRVPRSPTQAPMGSTSRLVEATATLARSPASRAVAFTSTIPSWISGFS